MSICDPFIYIETLGLYGEGMKRALIILCLACLIVMLWAVAIIPPVAAAQATDTPTPTPSHTPTIVYSWDVHCYVLIEIDPSIPAPAVALAWRAIRGMGQQLGQPDLITHYRIRSDNRAVIVESVFDPAEVNRDAVVNRLSFETGYSHDQVTDALTFTPFSCWQGYQASQAAARAYLIDNAAAWEVTP